MKLSLQQIKEITTGAVRIDEQDGAVCFYRFTAEQENLYKQTSASLYNKTFATAGVKLLFKTNSETLCLKGTATAGFSRQYYAIDVMVDGNLCGYIENFVGRLPQQDYPHTTYPLGDFSKEFQLGKGEKTVCVHLPWSVKIGLKEMLVDDGAFIEAIKPEKVLLAYGDSITMGYDALHPSERYIAVIADRLGAQEYNKGIGGEKFFPELATLKDDIRPDYITVAYGSNDWAFRDRELFMEKCKAFYSNIRRLYPKVKIFAITPIWRKDSVRQRQYGSFELLAGDIRQAVKDIENVVVIEGRNFVPEDENYFADLVLHPNDRGFAQYAENLYQSMQDYL